MLQFATVFSDDGFTDIIEWDTYGDVARFGGS
jgi:hypothetical protein